MPGTYIYTYNGLDIGKGTSYKVESVEGLLSLPEMRTHDVERQDNDGDWSGDDLLGPRIVRISLWVLGTPGSATETLLRNLRAAYKRIRGPVEHEALPWFSFQRPSTPAYHINARVRRYAFPSNYDLAHGLGRGAIELYAPDPLIYEATLSSTVINAGQTVTINNTGTAPVYPILEYDGPGGTGGTDLKFVNTTTGQTIDLQNYTIADPTIINNRKQTVVNDVGTTGDFMLSFDSEFWPLMPGNNSIQHQGPSGTVTVKFYPGHESL
jgi:phage-related protein